MTPAVPLQLPTRAALEAEARRRARHKIARYYPETGPLRRELYPKHTAFFAAGAEHPERLICAANRIGKSEGIGAYETTLHLTGRYPEWWTGRRFAHPIKAWAAGDTGKSVREIVQEKLLGPAGSHGTGMIQADCLLDTRAKSGVPDAIELIYVRHVSGGTSVCVLKSYDQKREAFQGSEQHLIWLDEEPPEDIYIECVMRTMATGAFCGGMVMLTFTPLSGWTEVVESFLNEQRRQAAGRWFIQADWNDAPHLSEAEKTRLWNTLPPHQRDARAKGIPALGSGAIYPVVEESITCDPFAIPDHWPRAYALDVGWNRTAALWGAIDRDSGTVYFYNEHYYAHSEPSENARAIRARGDWIPGVIDPAARGRSQKDGQQLLVNYRDLGLNLTPALNAVEAGIYDTWQLMVGARFKVFRSLPNWFQEFRKYRRDEKGRIVKENDHLMDAHRYFVLSGRDRAIPKPSPAAGTHDDYSGAGWMS